MKRALLLLVVLLSSLGSSAQELTIFDLDDFVDPRTLGAAATSKGRFLCPCTELLISRAMVGYNSDYMNVTVPTDVDVGFAHVATSYYRGAWQLNAKLTAMRDVHRPAMSQTEIDSRLVPRESAGLQLAYYRAAGAGEKTKVLRTQLTWRVSRFIEPRLVLRDDRFTREQVAVLRHELGTEIDVPGFRGTLGSLMFTWVAGQRPSLQQEVKPQTRLAYVLRSREYEAGAFRFDATLSTGVLGEGFDFSDLRRITIKPATRLAMPLGPVGTVNVRIAPTFQRRTRFVDDGGGVNGLSASDGPASAHKWERTLEVAIFVDRPIFRGTRFRAPKHAPPNVTE